MAKLTEITIETSSLLVLRARNSERAWCTRCAAEGEMISLENIGVISNLDKHAVEEWLNSQELHRTQSAKWCATDLPEFATQTCAEDLTGKRVMLFREKEAK